MDYDKMFTKAMIKGRKTSKAAAYQRVVSLVKNYNQLVKSENKVAMESMLIDLLSYFRLPSPKKPTNVFEAALLFVGTDSHRPAMQNLYITKNYLFATDGGVIFWAKLDKNYDDGFYIYDKYEQNVKPVSFDYTYPDVFGVLEFLEPTSEGLAGPMVDTDIEIISIDDSVPKDHAAKTNIIFGGENVIFQHKFLNKMFASGNVKYLGYVQGRMQIKYYFKTDYGYNMTGHWTKKY